MSKGSSLSTADSESPIGNSIENKTNNKVRVDLCCVGESERANEHKESAEKSLLTIGYAGQASERSDRKL